LPIGLQDLHSLNQDFVSFLNLLINQQIAGNENKDIVMCVQLFS